MANDILKMIDVALKLTPDGAKRDELKAKRKQFEAQSGGGIEFSTEELVAIGSQFGLKPAADIKDPRDAIVYALWFSGVARELGLLQDECLALDAECGPRARLRGLARLKFITQLSLIRRGLR